MQIFNLSNYKDPVYRNILLFCLLSFTAIGDILIPLLNYRLLELPTVNHNYINYTTLINTIPTLPFMFSIILGIIANQFNYANLIKVLSISFIIICGGLFFSSTSLLTLLSVTLVASLIFRIIYLALDKYLTTIIIARINDFQSDLFILGSIIGIVCYKLSAYIYTKFNSIGLISMFIILSASALYFASQIPINKTKPITPIHQYKTVCTNLIQDKKLIQFGLGILIFNFVLSGYNSYIMLIFKNHAITPVTFANLNSIAMLIGLVIALIPKHIYKKGLYHLLIIALSLTSFSMLLILINQHNLITYYITISALTSLIYLINNIIIFQLIGNNQLLKINAPAFLGVWATILYLNGVLSQIISNIGLNSLIKHQQWFLSILLIILLLNTVYLYIKKPAI